ncbi:hypothetical protein HPP92_016784 [Vanilla planifolia]|uniref:Thaumatin-like protein n=1 Tax=Vanilla planifolia TaxID=51239 RepID=A0A835USE5_VANPL|nr:hypothetical protein HPP92_016784 [Vanilla planifolia]
MEFPRRTLFLVVSLLLLPASFASCIFTILNNCPYTVWPGTLAGAGTLELASTGFRLDPGRTARLAAPPGWSGRLWGRTGCEFDSKGDGVCVTGDCGGKMQCAGAGAAPPATLFEITLGDGQQPDFYDVSLVDGYNLPLAAAPRVPIGTCNATGCLTDLNSDCPKVLQVLDGNGDGVVACRSACEAFGLDEYCCSGEFANPSSCKPSYYSGVFKKACPKAYSYAFDDGTSTFTCKARDYTIVFCPAFNRWRRSHGFSSAQPTQGDNGEAPHPHPVDQGEPPYEIPDEGEEASSASMLSSRLILITFFFATLLV